MLANHLAQRLERRRRPFLLDQKHRVDLARRIVHRHDQIHRRQTLEPGVPRAVLVQQHAPQRPARPLLAMRRTLRRLPHQARRVQRQLRHRVAQHVAVPLHQLLVEVLHREVRVLVPIQAQHPLQLLAPAPAAAIAAQAPVHQTLRPPPRYRSAQRWNVRTLTPSISAASSCVSLRLRPRPANSETASVVHPREWMPCPSCPLCSGHSETRHFTSYKHATDHQLLTVVFFISWRKSTPRCTLEELERRGDRRHPFVHCKR